MNHEPKINVSLDVMGVDSGYWALMTVEDAVDAGFASVSRGRIYGPLLRTDDEVVDVASGEIHRRHRDGFRTRTGLGDVQCILRLGQHVQRPAERKDSFYAF